MAKQLKDIQVAVGESKRIEWTWETECRDSGTTVSSSAWETADNSGSVTLSSPAISGNSVSVLVTGAENDVTGIINTVTLADGQVLKAYAYCYSTRLAYA